MASTLAEATGARRDGESIPVTDYPDPYELAYLRGGGREILKLRLFELMQMGYLIVIEKKGWFNTERWLAVAPDSPSRQDLPRPDQYFLDFFETRRTAKEIYTLRFPPELESACRQYRQELWQRDLLTGWLAPESDAHKKTTALGVFVAIVFVILAFALHQGAIVFVGFAIVFIAS